MSVGIESAMNVAPRITVYLTNHNYGRFIGQAIDSVLTQTLPDFELIVIDDGSTDDSRSIIESYSLHPKVVAIFQENKGLNVTNNIALRAARGEYIMRLDADDWLDPHALQVMAGILDRDPGVGLVFPDYYTVDVEGRMIELVRRHNFTDVELHDQPAHGACTMARRSCLLEIGGYDESFRCQDGWDIWIRVIQHYKVANVNLPLFYYRQHDRNLTRNEVDLLEARAGILRWQAQRKGRALTATAVVPVRGSHYEHGSIALQPLGDRAVLDWTLDAALECERIKTLAITTPDQDVLDHVASRYGNRIVGVARSAELARMNTHIEDTVFHALAAVESGGERSDAVAVLYAECPFRTPRQIDMAIDMLDVFETDTVVGVRPETDLFYTHNGKGLQPIRSTNELRLEREEIYRSAGKLYVVRREYFERMHKLTGGRIGHVVVDPHSAIQLSSDWDFEIARYWASRLSITRKAKG